MTDMDRTIEQPDRGTSGLVEQGSASRSGSGLSAYSSPAPFDAAVIHPGVDCSCRGNGLTPEVLGNSPIPVWDSASHGEVCNRCGCAWEIELMGEPNRKQEWCKEVDRLPAACFCHDEEFAADFLQRMDRLDIAAETVIGYIDPSGKGEGNWAESEWARLRADGFSESELRERSGAQ